MATINPYSSGLVTSVEKAVQNLARIFYKNHFINEGLHVGELIDEIIALLEIDVLYFDFQQPEASGKPIKGIYLRSNNLQEKSHKFVIHKNDSEKTQNFTILHELFHHLLMEDQTSELAQLLANEEILERAGDYFAACLLMDEKKFKMHFDFLQKTYAQKERFEFEKIVFKLSDAFITPYESVVRRLAETGLLKNEQGHLLEYKEDEFILRREAIIGPTVLDSPSKKAVFQPYVNLIVKGLENKDLSYMDAIKRLNRVNPKRAQEIEAEYVAKLATLEDDKNMHPVHTQFNTAKALI